MTTGDATDDLDGKEIVTVGVARISLNTLDDAVVSTVVRADVNSVLGRDNDVGLGDEVTDNDTLKTLSENAKLREGVTVGVETLIDVNTLMENGKVANTLTKLLASVMTGEVKTTGEVEMTVVFSEETDGSSVGVDLPTGDNTSTDDDTTND